MRVLIFLIFVLLSPVTFAQDQIFQEGTRGWRGLVPLKATRRDVEGLLGSPKSPGGSSFETDGQFISVEYSDGPCEKGWPYGWSVDKDTVTGIWVAVGKRILLADLKLDEKKYQKSQDSHIQNRVYYIDYDQGVAIMVDDFTTEVIGFNYLPTSSEEKLRCPDAQNRLPVGRQQADSFSKFDAYGDPKPSHERYRLDLVAAAAVREADNEIYIIAYAGRVAQSGEAAARATCARDYLIKEHRIREERIHAIDGGYRYGREVEIYLEPKDGDIPLATPSLRPSKVKIIDQKNATTCNVFATKDPPNSVEPPDGLVSVDMGDVFRRGNTKIQEVTLTGLPQLPLGFASLNGKAYRVTTEAEVSGPYDAVFKVSSVTDEKAFKNLRILHVEPDEFDPYNRVWVDRTGSEPNGPSHDFRKKTVTGHSEDLEPGFYMVARVVPNPTKADLEVTAKASPDSVQMPAKARMTVTIKNNGPNVATDVGVFGHLPRGEVVSSKPSSGTCKTLGAAFSCKLGQLAVGGSTKVNVLIDPPAEYGGEFSPRFKVGARENDTNPDNNKTEATVMLLEDSNVPPKVSLLSLESDLFEQGDTVVLKATASDDDGVVAKVEFFDNFKSLGDGTATDTQNFTLTASKLANGNHHLHAIATDNAGRTTQSAPIALFVNGPMKVRIVEPKPGALMTPGAEQKLVAEVEHPSGSIKKVEFHYTHHSLLGKATQTERNRFELQLRDLHRATYDIVAIATDDRGSVSMSRPFRFSVANPPEATLVAPADGTNLVAPANIEVVLNYKTPNWLSRMEIFANDERIEGDNASDTGGKYSFTWKDVKAGKYVLKAVVFDDIGVRGESSSVTIVVKNP